ncbi:hypothetical protein KCU62_g300, partial [Aureobasidium sp. EXF-3399]
MNQPLLLSLVMGETKFPTSPQGSDAAGNVQTRGVVRESRVETDSFLEGSGGSRSLLQAQRGFRNRESVWIACMNIVVNVMRSSCSCPELLFSRRQGIQLTASLKKSRPQQAVLLERLSLEKRRQSESLSPAWVALCRPKLGYKLCRNDISDSLMNRSFEALRLVASIPGSQVWFCRGLLFVSSSASSTAAPPSTGEHVPCCQAVDISSTISVLSATGYWKKFQSVKKLWLISCNGIVRACRDYAESGTLTWYTRFALCAEQKTARTTHGEAAEKLRLQVSR